MKIRQRTGRVQPRGRLPESVGRVEQRSAGPGRRGAGSRRARRHGTAPYQAPSPQLHFCF